MRRQTIIGSGLLERLERYRRRNLALKEESPVLYLDRVLAHGCMKLDVLDAAVRAKMGGDGELAERMDRFDQALYQMISEIGDAVEALKRVRTRGRRGKRSLRG
jgi:hypothetical protein